MESNNIFILSDKKIKYAQNLPLIETIPLKPKIDISVFDALIFTSKNGVKHLDALSSKWKNIPSYAISSQTAKVIEKLGGVVEFIGKKGHGDQFAHEVIPFLQGKKVAFIGAKNIVSDLVNILHKHNIECEHIAIYETQCKKYKEGTDLPSNAIIIFSSPSTIECFLRNFEWKKTYKAISIGDTTAQYFPDKIKPFIADETSLESCVQKALSLN